ncbi:MAG: major capsid protein [Microvirus sp.]|nr:MAG: major capsid protein [Microvirus sp.]
MIPVMKMPNPMKSGHSFSMVPSVKIERSQFDRSHAYKTTFNAGDLVPFYVDEALPGDTFNLQLTALARLATPIKPLMDNLYFETFFFFVPLRLVWTNFVKFMGEQEPSTFTAYTWPQMTPFGPTLGSITDYFGIAGTGGGAFVTSLPYRCYNLIYNQWFRDENLIASAVVDMGDGPDAIANYFLRKRGKRHDYFTSCLPWAQKAGSAVTLPLGTSAPVVRIGATSFPQFVGATSAKVNTKFTAAATAGATATQVDSGGAGNWTAGESLYWNTGATASGLQADLSTATAATINAIRQAFQIQKFLERDARGGTRYTEKIRAHFGVVSPDARLQRSEYLGGGSTPVVVNAVAQTTSPAAPTNKDALANLGGIGQLHAHGHGFTKSFTEHGFILGLMNVRADLTYQQGTNRMWKRLTPYDMFWPEFAHLGEQTVTAGEIYTVGGAGDDVVFGYQERYAEYRYKPSMVTGLFRSNAAGTLDLWHCSEKFVAAPTLGTTFIEDQTHSILARNLAVPTEPDFYFDSYIRLICARPMPVFGVPGMVDHF